MEDTNKKVFFKAIIFFLIFTCVIGIIPNIKFKKTYAINDNLNFDKINVIEDLESSTIDGTSFDFSKYPKNPYGTVQAITFVEYCYSFYDNAQENYALYLYVYNPALLDLSETSPLNQIRIAITFSEKWLPIAYKDFQIEFVNKSEGDYYKLFYKFKVIDLEHKIFNVIEDYAKSNFGARRYHISGVKLLTVGAYNADNYKIARSFEYSGFAEGYGPSENFPLTTNVYDLETLELKVHSTYYRPKGENVEGTHVQDTLNSVYFAVDNALIQRYGGMYAAHVQWYEYLTKEIFIVGNQEVYNKLKNYIGTNVTAYNENAYYGFAVNRQNFGPNDQYNWAEVQYNLPAFVNANGSKVLNTLYYLFSSNGAAVRDYMLSSKEFQEYLKTWSNNLGNKTINGKYSSYLFYDYVENGRKYGWQEHTITSDKGFNLTSYVLQKLSWWEKLWGIKNYTKTTYDGIKGVHIVTENDMLGSPSAICERLYIAESDYTEFKAFYDKSKTENKTVHLLRYAVTEYVAKPTQSIYGVTALGITVPKVVDENNYMAQQTVFLDFEIIDVTFRKDGIDTVIPVVSSPIDVINDITPPVNWPEDGLDWLQIILLVVLLVLLIIILSPILGPVFGVVGAVVKLPFEFIGSFFKNAKKVKEPKQRKNKKKKSK